MSPSGLLPFRFLGLALALALSACRGFLPSSGPSASKLQDSRDTLKSSNIQLVELTPEVVSKINSGRKVRLFSEVFTDRKPKPSLLGAGDAVEVHILEAQPAGLFGSGIADLKGGGQGGGTLPEQMIDSQGSIKIPFAGEVNVTGLRVRDVEDQITAQLRDKANQPQVMVRQTRNATSQVTVMGETNVSARMPLTPSGERLLDALAATGGLKQPVNRMTIQLTRGTTVMALPLATIIADPRQNIPLHPGDVVTALALPLSFTALGATGKNQEFDFEAKGISLTQALARAGGLVDTRSNSKGVFIFRFEDPEITHLISQETTDKPPKSGTPAPKKPKNQTPVIYALNLQDPASFFVAKSFPIKDGDTLYISNAPAAEFTKFMALVSQVTAPVYQSAQIRWLLNRK
jgi:polysaccharide export outer membrane protein